MLSITFAMAPMSLSQFKSLNWAHLRKVRKRLFVAPLFGILILAINLSVDAKYKSQSIDLTTGISILAFAFLIYGFFFFNINKTINKNYLNTSALADGMTVTLTETSISLHSKLVNSEHPWPVSYKQAIRIKNWVILSSGPASAYFLDTEKIISPATITDLEALLQHKGIKIKN
jgi:hypothetical protein